MPDDRLPTQVGDLHPEHQLVQTVAVGAPSFDRGKSVDSARQDQKKRPSPCGSSIHDPSHVLFLFFSSDDAFIRTVCGASSRVGMVIGKAELGQDVLSG
jgi:hypothetical protein